MKILKKEYQKLKRVEDSCNEKLETINNDLNNKVTANYWRFEETHKTLLQIEYFISKQKQFTPKEHLGNLLKAEDKVFEMSKQIETFKELNQLDCGTQIQR